ncbi:MAG: hypothetical protein M1282_18910 [Chloroflexi bacterium]|nr:hypothetical protein [Chloroflexota bacterium]
MRKTFFSILVLALVASVLPLSASAEAPAAHYPIYRLYNAAAHDHLYTASTAEVTSAEQAGYVSEGTLGQVSARVLTASQTPFYRLYDKKTHRHFYTDSNDELAALVAGGDYILEGTLGYLADPLYSTYDNAVFRLYQPTTGDHLYTGAWVEWGTLQLSGWLNEGMLRGKLF